MTFGRTEACLGLALLLMIDPSFPTKKFATDLHQPSEQWLPIITKVLFQLIVHKTRQVHRHIQNSVKHLRWSILRR